MSALVYAVQTCGAPRAARLTRPLQRQAAGALLISVSATLHTPLTTSKAHSRALVAAAAAQAQRENAALGIDLEYIDETRPMRQILAMLPGDVVVRDEVSARDFYRGWTFAEAHYKALGAFPSPGLLRAAVHDGPTRGVRNIGDDISVMYEDIGQDFVLCLVWRGIDGPLRRL